MKLANNLVVRNPNLAASKLEHLASRIEANQTWAAMARRNQAVALIAAGEGDRALQVLLDGKERYPGYRDFDFVLIWLLLQINEVDMAEAMLESLKLEAESDYVHGYQRLGATTRWLKSRLEQRKGRPDYAAMHLSAALQSDGWRPVYLEDLTRLGVPGRHLRSLLPVLSQVCWKNPHQVPAVSTLLSDAGLHAELEALHQNLLIPQSIRHDLVNSTRPGPDGQIRLEGEFTARHSLSRINRTLALWLDRHGYPLEIAPSNYPTQENEVHPEIAPVLPLLAKPLGRPAITVRHGWPHDFTPVGTGKLVMMFPWEYGSIPREWARGLAEADEIWVLTHYVRDVLVANGLDPGKIAIVPAGVDPALFRPEGHAKQFAGAKGFTFLFVGGTILRKGVDLLVEAYCQEFGPNEDVTLVIKDFGAGSIYTDTLLEAIELRALQPGTPHILINRDTFSDEDLAALYRGCGALVHPYRGEGFGMPIAEAMACGAPVVVTGAGACLDFCNDEVAYLVPAEEVMAGETALEHLGPMVQAPTWFEVQVEDLRRQMRHIYENREEARHKGQKAARFITENFTWDHAFARAGERLRTLLARQ
ncbi:MAG: glycosyltransferase [Bacillota bacterium]